ncbi:hypothetical protein HIM_01996 [Hirsutella minnesotensis 3608]|nr:hypothetical protein HIM_01996 [Hirsutella minnesotensis 3608]
MEEPYSNVKCKHTFEKAAILDYLPARGGNAVQCPQTGCSQTFSRATFDTDFYLDQAILRRVQRARQAQENEDMEDDDDDDDDDGEDMTVRGQRHLRDAELKRERLSMA